AVPRLDRHVPGQKRLTTIEGAPPDPLHQPKGCRFAPRCPFRIPKCDEHPELLEVGPGRRARCWVPQAGLELPKGVEARPAEPRAARVGPGALARSGGEARGARDAGPILEVRDLVKHFPLRKDTFFGRRQVVHAVDGVDLTVFRGETVGLVGESGCGKSTLARLITRIHEPTSGVIRFEGEDIAHGSRRAIRPLRRRMQMIFQDPYASLNPRMTVGDILAEPIRFHGLTPNERATRERVQELLSLVGLNPRAIDSYPHEFSGGQRQRIGTARALAVDPEFIVADEPISSLDVNIQAQVINLFVDLQERFNLTYLFIAHDLAVVRHVSDRVVVLYLGRVMEIASATDLFDAPLHPYTVALLSAVPIPDAAVERSRERIRLEGEPPSAIRPPSGCRFRTRCPLAQEVCAAEVPPLVEHRPGHWAACHFAGRMTERLGRAAAPKPAAVGH
ncbi:MAG TPA: dipeptide ABC transporter ATP-binding protein, partial [Geminicoccaceae bacterium]|nr:dipeptide ABC transporter ATP-binding protein [Geminicoccaceae bacterium]